MQQPMAKSYQEQPLLDLKENLSLFISKVCFNKLGLMQKQTSLRRCKQSQLLNFQFTENFPYMFLIPQRRYTLWYRATLTLRQIIWHTATLSLIPTRCMWQKYKWCRTAHTSTQALSPAAQPQASCKAAESLGSQFST